MNNDRNINKIGAFLSLIFFLIINPFIACILGLYCISRKKIINVSVVVVVIFAALYGYSYLSYNNDDITRHYYFFSVIREMSSLKEFFLYETVNLSPDFGMDLIYLILGKMTDSHQIVGLFGAGLFYGLLLGIIITWLKNYKVSNYQFAFLGLVFLLLAFIPSNEFNGMRQCNANALFIYFIISDKISKLSGIKRIIVLFIPALIHFSLIPIIILYLVSRHITYKKAILYAFILIIISIVLKPVMQGAIYILPKFGLIGIGIASKIESYMFSGEVEAELHMGSSVRFYLLILFVIIFPLLLKQVLKFFKTNDQKRKTFLIFSILFYGYMILTASTYAFSRTLMLFKIILGLLIVLLAYGISVPKSIKSTWKLILWGSCILGPIFLIQAKEYRVINYELFTDSLFGILSIATDPAGYPI